MMEDLKEEFRAWQKKHPNFMTPHIIKLLGFDDFVVELSEGTGINHEPIYGVTLEKRIGEFDFVGHGGKMFYNFDEAKGFADEIVKKKLGM